VVGISSRVPDKLDQGASALLRIAGFALPFFRAF